MNGPLTIGSPVDPVRTLAAGLGGTLVELPPAGAGDAELEGWRADVGAGSPVERVVVAVWAEQLRRGPADQLDLAGWIDRAERPLHGWVAALGAAVQRCADGGSIVCAVERPSPLDSAGWAPEAGIADAVEALVRSLARSEGPRRVRVNTVATAVRTAPADPIAPAPPLDAFPGTVERDVVGAVRLLLDDDGSGLTGTIVHADLGRSWR